ncbi:hypothetical protein B9Z55_025603 [Caenorhabditis nigoni]|nr:hypothetical protein B9Z55_025603 [Caenorhabditis nigoni]
MDMNVRSSAQLSKHLFCPNQKPRDCGIGMVKMTNPGKEPKPTKPNVEIKETRGEGKGLYATKFIEAGSFAIPLTSNHNSEKEKIRDSQIKKDRKTESDEEEDPGDDWDD